MRPRRGLLKLLRPKCQAETSVTVKVERKSVFTTSSVGIHLESGPKAGRVNKQVTQKPARALRPFPLRLQWLQRTSILHLAVYFCAALESLARADKKRVKWILPLHPGDSDRGPSAQSRTSV